MATRLGIIDLGTNSARLLVADVSQDGTWFPIAEHRIACRLGAELAVTHEIDAAAEERSARALEELVQRARALGEVTLRVIATHALRAARNGAAVQKRLEARCGEPIQCLSGATEAHLVLLAAEQLLRPTADEPLVALDLGGGSLEFAVQPAHAQRRVSPRLVSLPLGAVVLAQGQGSGVVSASFIQDLRSRVRRMLAEEAATLRGVARQVVVAGGPSVCAAALLGFPAPWNGVRFAPEAFEELIGALAAMDLSERAALPAVGDRADIIVPGLIVLQEAVRHVGAADCLVLEQGVRAGALLALSRGEL